MNQNVNIPAAKGPAKRRQARRKPNAPASCIGLKVNVAPGKNAAWYAENGYPALYIVREGDGSLTVYINYLGAHHPKLRADEVVAEVGQRLVILG